MSGATQQFGTTDTINTTYNPSNFNGLNPHMLFTGQFTPSASAPNSPFYPSMTTPINITAPTPTTQQLYKTFAGLPNTTPGSGFLYLYVSLYFLFVCLLAWCLCVVCV